MSTKNNNQLRDFYNNHYKNEDSLKWEQLSVKQRDALEQTQEYFTYSLNLAFNQFRIAAMMEVEKLIVAIKKLTGE